MQFDISVTNEIVKNINKENNFQICLNTHTQLSPKISRMDDKSAHRN